MFDKITNDEEESNEILTPNPLTSKEEADSYIENGALPIIGISAGPGGNSIKGQNIQNAVKLQYESVGVTASKKLSKKAKMAGYKEPKYKSDIIFANKEEEVEAVKEDKKQIVNDTVKPKQEEFDFNVSIDKYDELVRKVAIMQSKIDSLELTLHSFKIKFKQFLDNTAFGEDY